MPLPADVFLDRIRMKNQLMRWRLIAIVGVVLAVIVATNEFIPSNSAASAGRDYIARLTIDGVVTDDHDRDQLIKSLRNNSHVKAVIVRLDTPGGSAVAGMETYKLLRSVSEAGKPVVAVMRDLSASAGYLIAIGTDHIFAREATLTGSIGVIIEAAEFSSLAEKLGVTPIVVKTGALKDALSPFSKATPEAREAMQAVVDDFFHIFINEVATRRQLPHDDVVKLADGRVFTGNQAVQNKLVDAIGGEDEALDWLKQQKPNLTKLSVKDVEVKHKKDSFIERVTGTVIQKIMPQASAKLDGLVAIWHPALQLQ